MSTGFDILTVSQLNFYVRTQLDADPMLRNVFLRAEISNFTNHYRSGHLYMSLKDENAVIKAVMFKGSAQNLNFMPQNGMKIIAMGRASLYDRDGSYQFYIDDMQPDGVGALHVAFEQLKQKLSDEGLFDGARKRPLPQYPERIGVITSPTGAALQDIRNILGRRWPLAQIFIYPVLVQGAQAPEQICRAIESFSTAQNADLLIIGRGGGSIEDLWTFNDEGVARSIAACNIPVVSAVGHETDFTIADFVADLRAPTPSAAAELASPDIEDIKAGVTALANRLARSAADCLKRSTLRLDAAVSSAAMREPVSAIHAHRIRYDTLAASLDHSASVKLRCEKDRLASLTSMLDALSPLKVLSRGYTIALGKNGVITTIKALESEIDFTLRLHDGQANCRYLNATERPNERL
jgi:exodeoxyribonuclease VII large subunit